MGQVTVLSDVYQGDWYLMVAVAGGLALLVGVLLAMAIIGIYAMLSFSVSERTREIGIRSALGASKLALVSAILRRSLVQIGLGALIGLPVAGLVVFELTGKAGQARSPVGMAAVGALGLAAGVVLIVGVFSCLAPALEECSPFRPARRCGQRNNVIDRVHRPSLHQLERIPSRSSCRGNPSGPRTCSCPIATNGFPWFQATRRLFGPTTRSAAAA